MRTVLIGVEPQQPENGLPSRCPGQDFAEMGSKRFGASRDLSRWRRADQVLEWSSLMLCITDHHCHEISHCQVPL